MYLSPLLISPITVQRLFSSVPQSIAASAEEIAPFVRSIFEEKKKSKYPVFIEHPSTAIVSMPSPTPMSTYVIVDAKWNTGRNLDSFLTYCRIYNPVLSKQCVQCYMSQLRRLRALNRFDLSKRLKPNAEP